MNLQKRPKARIIETDRSANGVVSFPSVSARDSDSWREDFHADVRPAIINSIFLAESLWPAIAETKFDAGEFVEDHTGQASETVERRGWEAGVEEGKNRALAECEKTIASTRAAVAETLKDFAGERELYYQRVEGEVLVLALAIARKILHREAQVDPLMLRAAVRLALGKLAEGTSVRLRVNPNLLAQWQQVMTQEPELKVKRALIGDPAVGPVDCLLEIEPGTTSDLSVETQLKEIEKGLFDLLAARPARIK